MVTHHCVATFEMRSKSRTPNPLYFFANCIGHWLLRNNAVQRITFQRKTKAAPLHENRRVDTRLQIPASRAPLPSTGEMRFQLHRRRLRRNSLANAEKTLAQTPTRSALVSRYWLELRGKPSGDKSAKCRAEQRPANRARRLFIARASGAPAKGRKSGWPATVSRY